MSSESEAPTIPGYRIEGVLGRGATGVVYRARQVSVDRVVALKVLHRELVGARRAEQRLQREARTTARLAHPNIISAIDMGEVGGVWWYAMELVDGVSLQDRLREGPLSEREALRLFIPLVEALQHAFERGVVHRDIKPGNILVERGGRARLVDLGLAVADDDPLLTKGGGTLGTPHYISPEQARDPRSADVQSDLWSLGATLYHAVCGRPPFEGDSVAEILSAVLYARVTDPAQLAPFLSRGFALVLRKCLTRDRAHRYATPAELLADLERVRERRAPKVAKAGLDPVVRDWRPARRAAGFAALVVAGLVGVWVIALMTGREPPVSADAARPSAPDAIAILENDAAGPVNGLTGALERAASLEAAPGLSAEARGRVADARRRITSRLESEVWEFERSAEIPFAKKLSERDFAEAEGLATRQFPGDLSKRVGAGKLPEALAQGFERWTAELASRVQKARQAALAEVEAAFGEYVTSQVIPRVDQLVGEGNWRAAREHLRFSPRAGEVEAGISLRGMTEAEIGSATESARVRLDERRAKLDEDWNTVDGELRSWVEERVGALRDGLVDRNLKDASSRLRSDWMDALASRRLTVERMPFGVPRTATEALAQGEKTLDEVERKVEDEDAHLRLSELQSDNSSKWRDRRYADIAQACENATKETWSAPFQGELELAALEARRLDALLRRAADGVRALDGQTVKLRIETITITGKMIAGTDPLMYGFRVKPERGQEFVFVLRGPSTTPPVLAGSALEGLAGLASLEAAGPADRLLLALFRWREGEPGNAQAARAAQAALDAGTLPSGDPLLAEIERRIKSSSLADAQSPGGERREKALEKLHLLRSDMRETGNRERKLKRAKEVLQYEDALFPQELGEVRDLRAALEREGTPSTLPDFRAAFGLPDDQIEFVANVNKPRAVIRFEFGTRATGAFNPGAWSPDGRGWIAPRNARTDEEMLGGEAPTLPLQDPLRIQSDAFEIQLEFEQPLDSPPDLFLVSAAGFQVVLVGGRKPRCLVETGDAAQAVADARSLTGGERFDGLDRDGRYGLRIKLDRAQGRAIVDLRSLGIGQARIEGDWRRLYEGFKLSPRGDDKSLALVVRSFERVRLLKAQIDAVRR